MQDLIAITPVLAIALAVVLGGVWVYQRKTAERRLLRNVLAKISTETESGLVIPDGMDGEIELDHVLLTDRGILVIDVKHANGPVFAGERLAEWSVVEGSNRHRFRNPLETLRARTAAVRALAKDVPVHGRVVFVGEPNFVGGKPEQTLTVRELEREFSEPGPRGAESARAFHASWKQIQHLASNEAA